MIAEHFLCYWIPCHSIRSGINYHDNGIHQQCWSPKNFAPYHFYIFLTLLLFHKIGSLGMQTKILSQTLFFLNKHHEASVSHPGRLELSPPTAKPSRLLAMHSQVKETGKGNSPVLQPGQMPSCRAQYSNGACQKAGSVVVMSDPVTWADIAEAFLPSVPLPLCHFTGQSALSLQRRNLRCLHVL